MLFNSEGIVALILKDDVHNGWLKNIQKKLAQLGLSMCDLPLLGLERARLVIKQRIRDIEWQNDLACVADPFIKSVFRPQAMARYLTHLELYSYRRAFTLARFNVLPSAVAEGRYKKIPYHERICPCGQDEVETAEHVLLRCNFYKDQRTLLIYPLLSNLPGRSSGHFLHMLLTDGNPTSVYAVAKFLAAAMKIRITVTNVPV